MVFDWLFKLFTRLQVAVFRRTNGKRLASMRGMPVLLLTTVGRKSRRPRTTPLMYIRDGPLHCDNLDNSKTINGINSPYVITASNNGRDKHPAWFLNLQASPQVEIDVPGKRLQATASIATAAEKDRLWPILVAQAPFFDDYRKKTTRQIPMVVLKPR